MKKGIFRRIFMLYFIIILLSGLFGELYIASTVRTSYIDNLEKSLAAQIEVISKDMSFSPGLDNLCQELRRETGARVTVIDKDGKVLGDSEITSALMENHINRPEIQQALFSGTGSSIRFSNTLKYNFLYVAKKISRGDETDGFVRLAVPLKEVERAVNILRVRIVAVVIIILLVTGAFAVWQTDHLRRLLGQITAFSRSLSRGDIDKRLFLKNAGEFNEIAENLTSMSEALQETISRSEEEKNRLNVILRSVPDALLIIDYKGLIIHSSASTRQFFGDIAIRGVQFADVVRNHAFSDLIEEVRGTFSPATAEFVIETPGEKYVTVRVSPLFYKENELSGFVAVFHDVTQIEKLERVRKDFVANVSHEIKTPITAIRGFADTLLEGALDDKENALKFLQTIKSNSERINTLVDDLMTISKIELGVIRVEKSPVEIGETFEHVLETFRGRASAKDISLDISNPKGISTIQADRVRLIQILTNLVDNALKFTETGHVTFGIDKEGERTFIFVEDTGIGIPPKHLPRLGERFYRVDPARSRKMGGTGLGLAIVKHLVKAHCWSMSIESTPGKGTKVRILI